MLHGRATCLVLVVLTTHCAAQGWPSSGGNAQRNALSPAYGPLTAQTAWTENRQSFVGWQPFIDGDRLFIVRQSGVPPAGEPNGSPVFSYHLSTGAELWRVDIPFNAGEWTTWVLGTSNGLVYAARSGNGTATPSSIYALDQASGATVWVSEDQTTANPYSGVVFAPNGDLIVGDFLTVSRISAADGTTVWSAPRNCSSNTSCGGAIFDDSLYVVDANRITRFDLETGALLYRSTAMPGGGNQHTPMVGPDGTVYINHAGNNPTTDFFHAFTDTGTELIEKWRVPCAYAPASEFAVGPDGWVYMLQREEVFTALDCKTGTVQAIYDVPFEHRQLRCAVDADGRVYVSDGGSPNTRVYSFDADLTLRWSMTLSIANIGGPALADDGTLILADSNAVFAFRTPSPWTDVGGGIVGVTGSSSLQGRGTMTGGNDVVLSLMNARPNAASTLLIGTSAICLPLLGGKVWPSPGLVAPGLPIGASGDLDLTLTWPSGIPAGTSFWFQHWYVDAAAVQGVAASNGLRGITP